MPSIRDVISAIETLAPPEIQEKWDNTGWQVRTQSPATECTGVLVCLDVSPAIVDEAASLGANLIISHHPVIFKGVTAVCDDTKAGRVILDAIRSGISIYSSHTALDSAPRGINARLASMLGLTGVEVLDPAADPASGVGLGRIGDLPRPMDQEAFVRLVREALDASWLRVTPGHGGEIRRVALCGGSGSEFIPEAIARGADAYVTSDTRYHPLLDFGSEILIVDTCHFESEKCAKSIFSEEISEKFPNFAVYMSAREKSPVTVD